MANNTSQNITGSQSTKDQLKTIVERIERLEAEKATLGEDIGSVYSEAKSNGYDVKTIRKLIALRKKEPHVVEEEENLLDIYKKALGM